MNAISTLTVLPRTKTEIKDYIDLVKSDILSGYVNPLESAAMLKSLEDIVKALRADEEIKGYILEEADKHQEKTVEEFGCKFQKRETPRYDYSVCDDSEYNRLADKLNYAKEQVKARENYLKSLKEPTINEDTGEVINPPVKTSTTSVSVTLPK